MVPLVIFMVWLGVRPTDFLRYSEQQITDLIIVSKQKSLTVMNETNAEELPDWTAKLYDLEEEEEEQKLVLTK